MADAAEVMRIFEPDDGNTAQLCALYRKLHGLMRDRLPHAAIAVYNDQRIGVRDNRDLLVQLQLARDQRSDVRPDHADAVRIMAGEIRSDEMIRHTLRFSGPTPGCEPQIAHPCAGRVGR